MKWHDIFAKDPLDLRDLKDHHELNL